MRLVVAYQKLRKIVLFIFIIYDKCKFFAQQFQFQKLRIPETHATRNVTSASNLR